MKKRTLVALSLLGTLAAANAFAVAITPTHMFGPNSPAFADTNGDGMVTGADAPIVATRTGPTSITLSHPWQAGINGLNTFALSNSVGGRFRTIGRTYGEGTQQVTVTGFTGAVPTQFTMTETGLHGTFNGTITLLDTNGDGILDTISVTGRGGTINFSMDFVYLDTNGDHFADYISIPWGMANLAGVNFKNTVNGRSPQVFLPLADTNGDGKGDAVIFDLDGDNVPDTDIVQAPGGSFGPVAAPSVIAPVPTLSEWVALSMVVLLAGVALWQLRALQARPAPLAV